MSRMNFIVRTLTGIIVFGFLIAAMFDILDYFIVKYLLFGTFAFVVVFMTIQLYKNENHPET